MFLRRAVSVIAFISLLYINGLVQIIMMIDATKVDTSILSGHLKMGSAGPLDKEILINNRYLTIGGKPDLTIYVKKGTNQIMLDFVFTEGKKAVAAKLVVDYFNNDETTINTDSTWLTKDSYMISSFFNQRSWV